MEINLPDVIVEVTAAFQRYEKALNANDIEVLDSCFWRDPRVIRYSLTDNAYGFEAVHASRLARPKSDLRRQLKNTVITTFGRDVATANTEDGQYRVPAPRVRSTGAPEPDVGSHP